MSKEKEVLAKAHKAARQHGDALIERAEAKSKEGMTIEDAIKGLRELPTYYGFDDDEIDKRAIQLGIEALERIKEVRATRSRYITDIAVCLLPSEEIKECPK